MQSLASSFAAKIDEKSPERTINQLGDLCLFT